MRLVLVAAGFPRPETQIPVYDEWGRLMAIVDLGWPEVKVGVDYEGAHHRMSRRQFDRDIRRHADLTELGWDDVRITAEDSDGAIIGRVGRALQRRARATANFGADSRSGVTFGAYSVSSIRVLPRMLGLT